MMRVLVLFAFPREVRAVVRALSRRKPIGTLPFGAFCVRDPLRMLTMAETGLGIENAERVLSRLIGAGRPDAVISLGYCGALSRDLAVGDVIWASGVFLVDGRQLQELPLRDERGLLEGLRSRLPVRPGTIFTMKTWVRKEELMPLVSPGMAAPVCDMETFGLAWICHDRKLPFHALRAVSDGAERDLAFDPWAVCDAHGTYRVTRALRFLLSRPRLLAHATELRRSSKVASRNLGTVASALFQIL